MILLFQIDTIAEVVNKASITSVTSEVETIWGIPITILRIAIPALISISLFFLGFFINWLNKKRERKNSLKSTKIFISKWIELLKKPIIQQIRSCRKFATDLRESDYITTEKFGFLSLLVDRLNEVTLQSFTDTFLLNHKGNEQKNSGQLFNLISSIEYFTNLESELRTRYSKFEKDTIEIMNSWNNAVRDLDKLKLDYSEKIKNTENHPSKGFYDDFVLIGLNFQVKYTKGATISQMKETVMEPLRKSAQEYLMKNNKDKLAIEALNVLSELNILIWRWNIHRLAYSQIFLQYGIDALRTFKTIMKSIDHFDAIEFKSILKIN